VCGDATYFSAEKAESFTPETNSDKSCYPESGRVIERLSKPSYEAR